MRAADCGLERGLTVCRQAMRAVDRTAFGGDACEIGQSCEQGLDQVIGEPAGDGQGRLGGPRGRCGAHRGCERLHGFCYQRGGYGVACLGGGGQVGGEAGGETGGVGAALQQCRQRGERAEARRGGGGQGGGWTSPVMGAQGGAEALQPEPCAAAFVTQPEAPTVCTRDDARRVDADGGDAGADGQNDAGPAADGAGVGGYRVTGDGDAAGGQGGGQALRQGSCGGRTGERAGRTDADGLHVMEGRIAQQGRGDLEDGREGLRGAVWRGQARRS